MKITEQDRLNIQTELESLNSGLWIGLASEIHYFGDEAPFWFLVSDPAQIQPAYEIATKVLRPYLERIDGTKFSVSFNQKANGKLLIWDVIEDEELRTGRLAYPLGESAEEFPLRDHDVFGPNLH